MGKKKKKNHNKHGREYKNHSRKKYGPIRDWPDFDANGNAVPLRRPRQSKRERQAAKYMSALEDIILLELGDYYWSGTQQEELNDDTHTNAGR